MQDIPSWERSSSHPTLLLGILWLHTQRHGRGGVKNMRSTHFLREMAVTALPRLGIEGE